MLVNKQKQEISGLLEQTEASTSALQRQEDVAAIAINQFKQTIDQNTAT